MKFPQIFEITAANDLIEGQKRGNMDKKFPQSWKIFSGSDGMTGSFLMSALTTTNRVSHTDSGMWGSDGGGFARNKRQNLEGSQISKKCV